VPAAALDEARRHGPKFVEAARIGYVVVDRSRSSRALIEAATSTLGLEKIGEAGTRDLYRPRVSAALAGGPSGAAGGVTLQSRAGGRPAGLP
jgi:hypothetical protein